MLINFKSIINFWIFFRVKMGGLEAVITGLWDELNLKKMRREHFTIIILFSSFLGALISCTQVSHNLKSSATEIETLSLTMK